MIPADVLGHARRLRARTRRLVNGHFAGQYLSVFKGSGVEFAEVREYVPGDDIRSIDWNVSARSGRAFVKRYVEERNLTVMLAVDVSGSTAFGGAGSAKRERAVEIALSLAVAALDNGDRVGLLVFSDQVEFALPPRRGRNTGLAIASNLLAIEPQGKRTSLRVALEYLGRVCTHRSLVFVLSDFIDEADYEHALRGLAARHDVVPLWLHDALEFELPNVGLVALRDLETGEQTVLDTASTRVRDAYRASRAQAADLLRKRFSALRLDHVGIGLDEDWPAALMSFFRARARRLESGR